MSWAKAIALLALLPGAAFAQSVYRCGNTYSDEPCKGGKTVDTSPAVSDPRGPSTKEIYLCKAPHGGLYWTAEHCARRGWTIERIQRVPANVSWDDQVAAGRQQRDRAEAISAMPVQRSAQQVVPQSPQGKNPVCAALDERVAMLDSMGRAGSQYYDLDWVRRERKAARDEQHRRGC